jgi:hypothetical protein
VGGLCQGRALSLAARPVVTDYITPHEIQIRDVPDTSILYVYVCCQCTNVVRPDLALAAVIGMHVLQRVMMPVLLWACKRPLPYSHRRPTLFQPMRADIDVVGSIQGVGQRVEQTHPPMVLRSRRCQFWEL